MSGLIQNLPGGVLDALSQQPDRSTFNLDVGSPFQENLQGIEDVLRQRGLAADEQANPLKFSTETGDDGRLVTTVTAPHEEILKIQEKMKLLDQILGSFHDRSEYLQAQEQRGRQKSPILQALSSVAGHLAAGDKRLPPIVQALGKANLEMNPPQQVLAQRAQEASMAEAAVAKEQAGLAQASLGLQLEEERIKETNKQKKEALDLAKEKVLDAKIKNLNQEARLVAKGSGGQPMSFKAYDALARQKGITDVEKIHQGYVAHEEEAMDYKHGLEEAEKTRAANLKLGSDLAAGRAYDLEEHRQRGRMGLQREREAFATSDDKLTYATKESKMKAAVHNAAAADKEISTLGPDMKKLETAAQTDAYLDKIQGGLEKVDWKQVTGPLVSVYKNDKGEWDLQVNFQKALPRAIQSKERVEMEAAMQHEIPRILSTVLGIQGGASILRSEEGRKMIAKLGASINDRPDQITKILDTVRDTNNDTKRTVMQAHYGIDWTDENRRTLLGMDNPRNQRYFAQGQTSMGTKIGEKVAPPARQDAAVDKLLKAGETQTRRQNPTTKKWWVFKDGKWQEE